MPTSDKRYMLDLGIGKDDFNAITWFTSWAVDADHGSDLCGTGWSSDLQIRYIFLSVEIIKRYCLSISGSGTDKHIELLRNLSISQKCNVFIGAYS